LRRRSKNPDKELELFDHLAELRTRVMRCLIYVGLAMCVTWFVFDQLYTFLLQPAITVLKATGGKFLQTSFVQGFTLRMQVSFLGGLILTLPLLTLEAWGFVAPGLTRQERKAVYFVAPLSIVLFFAGIAICYFSLPRALAWFVSMQPPNTALIPDVSRTLIFMVQMYLAFGLMFELPVVLMFLGKVGIINSRLMVKYWREATVVIAFLAALITPSNDAFTMTMMAAPMVLLYFLSISLVRWVEARS